MRDPKYDEHTRFIKTLRHFVKWDLSDWYPNNSNLFDIKIYEIIPRLAPYATKLYKSYRHNIDRYARFEEDAIRRIARYKQPYLEEVFSNAESTEYDKMTAASIIIHEFIMWSRI